MNEPTKYSLDLPPFHFVDFAAFGETESLPLSKIQKLTGAYLSRNWVAIPQVTHHDEADITNLDIYRKQLAEETGVRLTPLAFIMKAMCKALSEFPKFNASLDLSGNNLILKKYFHIGVAVDTPAGLLVAVIRDCDKKTTTDLAEEILTLSSKAREKGLPMSSMVGGCMTVSSLGHIGGTAFSPIINAPEVAILGITKAQWKPVRNGNEIEWRFMLPLSLTYDHRVINGVDAAKFSAFVAEALSKPEDLL